MTDRQLTQSNRQAALREDARFRMLRALERDPDLSQRGLARETGISLGAVNALLNRLIETGLVKIGKSQAAPAGFRFAYALTATGRVEARRLAGRYLQRRRADRDELRKEIAEIVAQYGAGADPQG